MSRLLALVLLTGAFAPAAVLGALPLVAPVVALLALVLAVVMDVMDRRAAPPPARVSAPGDPGAD